MQRNVLNILIRNLIVLISVIPNILLAQSFQHELSYDFSKITESGTAGERIGNRASYTYYFSAIENSELPWAELEFGNRISSLGFGYSVSDLEDRQFTVGASTLATGGASTRLASLSGIYKHPVTGWYFGGNFFTGETESSNDENNQGYQLNFGKYLAERTTISLDYSKSESDPDSVSYTVFSTLCGWQANGSFVACGPGSFVTNTLSLDRKQETDAFTIKGRHLQELAGYYFALGLHYTDSETTVDTLTTQTTPVCVSSNVSSSDSATYGGEITAYFTKRFSSSLFYSKTEQDQLSVSLNEPEKIGISLDYYFLFGFSASLDYTLIKVDSITPPATLPVGVSIVPRLNPSVIAYSQFRNYSPSMPYSVYSGNTILTGDQEMFSLNISARF